MGKNLLYFYDINPQSPQDIAAWVWECGLLYDAPLAQIIACRDRSRSWTHQGRWSIGMGAKHNPKQGFIEGFLAMGGTDGGLVFPNSVIRVSAGNTQATVAYRSGERITEISPALALLH